MQSLRDRIQRCLIIGRAGEGGAHGAGHLCNSLGALRARHGAPVVAHQISGIQDARDVRGAAVVLHLLTLNALNAARSAACPEVC